MRLPYVGIENDYCCLGAGIPIFVSECAGMECTGDGPLDIEEWTRWVEWMEAHKISWVNWSISDKNETCSMLFTESQQKRWLGRISH